MAKKKRSFKLPPPNVFLSFLPFAVAITLLSGFTFATGQQVIRQSANDPQVQLAEDTARSISQGSNINPGAFSNKVDISKSLAAFIIIFDSKGNVIASNAIDNGKVPPFPKGALTYAHDHGENVVSWETSSGARSATVIVPFKNTSSSGYILVGRSLRGVEARVERLAKMTALGWLATMIATFISFLFVKRFFK